MGNNKRVLIWYIFIRANITPGTAPQGQRHAMPPSLAIDIRPHLRGGEGGGWWWREVILMEKEGRIWWNLFLSTSFCLSLSFFFLPLSLSLLPVRTFSFNLSQHFPSSPPYQRYPPPPPRHNSLHHSRSLSFTTHTHSICHGSGALHYCRFSRLYPSLHSSVPRTYSLKNSHHYMWRLSGFA